MKTIETQAKTRLLQRQSYLLELRARRALAVGGDVTVAAADSESEELRDIARALGKLDEGRYGLCESCGTAIGRQRLTAIPEARVCVACTETVFAGPRP